VPADVTDTRWLYWRIADAIFHRFQHAKLGQVKWRLGGVFDDYLDIPLDFPVATAFDADLTKALKALGSANITPRPKIVLLLDEVERLLPNKLGKEKFRGFFDFFAYFRGVSQETRDFVMIVTGANTGICEEAQFEGRDNPVFNYFREVYLQLLEPEECAPMMRTLGRGMGLRFSDGACDYVYRLTGGHPYFARELCSFVANRHRKRPLTITREIVSEHVDTFLEIAGKDFDEIMKRLARDYPSERAVCVELAKHEGTVPVSALAGDHVGLRHLEGYQIVQIRGQRVGITMDLMRLWLQRIV
jgi:hypothetical protein